MNFFQCSVYSKHSCQYCTQYPFYGNCKQIAPQRSTWNRESIAIESDELQIGAYSTSAAKYSDAGLHLHINSTTKQARCPCSTASNVMTVACSRVHRRVRTRSFHVRCAGRNSLLSRYVFRTLYFRFVFATNNTFLCRRTLNLRAGRSCERSYSK